MHTDVAINSTESVTDESEFVPIREISRITGVNTVTLRAWERRYGLLVPQRTGKGHRLYSLADIERVKEIQLWLGRGLAISKVKALLAHLPQEQENAVIDSNWLQLARQMHEAINRFQRNALERLLADILSLYPAEMVADNLLVPLLQELKGDEPGMRARCAFFFHLASGMILEAQSRQRQSANGSQVLVLSAAPQQYPLLEQMFGYSLLINQYAMEYLGYLPPREALLAAQALDAKILVILGYEVGNAAELQLHLSGLLGKFSIPVLLIGDEFFPYTFPAKVAETPVSVDGQGKGDTGPEFTSSGAAESAVQVFVNQQQALNYINQNLNG